MQASAAFDSGSPVRAFVVLVAAVVAALLIGGMGGYAVRALTYPASAAITTAATPRPFVVEQAPYGATATPDACHWSGTPPTLAC